MLQGATLNISTPDIKSLRPEGTNTPNFQVTSEYLVFYFRVKSDSTIPHNYNCNMDALLYLYSLLILYRDFSLSHPNKLLASTTGDKLPHLFLSWLFSTGASIALPIRVIVLISLNICTTTYDWRFSPLY